MGRTRRNSATEELELLNERNFADAYRLERRKAHSNGCGDMDALPWCDWCVDQARRNNPALFLKYRNALIGEREKEYEELRTPSHSRPTIGRPKRSHFRWRAITGRIELRLICPQI